MASKVHSRPMRPPPSRRSNFIADVPTVIYSRAAADFRPPADYVGPRKSLMQRPPDPSLNPKGLSLPILSVSRLDVQAPASNTTLPRIAPVTVKSSNKGVGMTKLNVQVAVPPSSKTSLPRIEKGAGPAGKPSNRIFECPQAKNILRNMPSSFRRQFRSELRKKRPITGRVHRFVHRDIHDTPPPEQPLLHGIILLGGKNRNLIEEVPQEPGTPPPLSGRVHCVAQTDTYLEDIADNEDGFIDTEMQCDPLYDEILEASPLNFEEMNEEINLASTGTQLDQWVFSDIYHAFDQVGANLADAVIMESLKQLQEEFELEALRKQHEFHKCLRNREMSILAKYKEAQEKYEEQKRILESRKPWDQTLDQIIQLVGFDKVRETAPLHFIGDQTSQAVYEHIQNTMIPPMNSQTEMEVGIKKLGRNVLDHIIEESVMKREAEYAGKMYIRDPKKKGSLATESPSRQSVGEYEDWYDDDEYDLQDYEIPGFSQVDQYDGRPLNGDPAKWQGEAWDDMGRNRSSSASADDAYDNNQQGYDDDDDVY